MKLTDEDKQELYDSITFLIEMIDEYPEYADEVLDSLGWGDDPMNVKKLQQIRKKLFKAELRPSYRSYMD